MNGAVLVQLCSAAWFLHLGNARNVPIIFNQHVQIYVKITQFHILYEKAVHLESFSLNWHILCK